MRLRARPTPETDAHELTFDGAEYVSGVVSSEFAEGLERQPEQKGGTMIDWEKYNRSQAAISGLGFVEVDIKDYEEMRAAIEQLAEARMDFAIVTDELVVEQSAHRRTREQIDRLAEALRQIKRFATTKASHSWLGRIAAEALATLDRKE